MPEIIIEVIILQKSNCFWSFLNPKKLTLNIIASLLVALKEFCALYYKNCFSVKNKTHINLSHYILQQHFTEHAHPLELSICPPFFRTASGKEGLALVLKGKQLHLLCEPVAL